MKKIHTILLILFIVLSVNFSYCIDPFFIYFKTFNGVCFCYNFVENIHTKNILLNTMKNGNVLSFKFLKDNDILYRDNIINLRRYLVSQEVKVEYKKSIITKLITDLNLKILEHERVENRFVIYAYSNKLNKFLRYKNENMNLQIVVFNKVMIIGYPIIYSGF